MSSASASLATTSQILSSIRQCPHGRRRQRRSAAFTTRSKAESPEQDHRHGNDASVQSSRRDALRMSLAAAAATLLAGPSVRPAFAAEEASDNNGYWLTGPLPEPSVTNKLANEATGTRSFVEKGIFMANVGAEGSAYRLKSTAFDLLALSDMVGQDDMWPYLRRYLHLKATFMYYDFDKVITASPTDQKQPLTDLANRLFDRLEKLDDAIKKRDGPTTQSSYGDATGILQEVMIRMA